MTANQLKSNAVLAISALVAGTVISTGAHFVLTSRDAGDELDTKSNTAEVTAIKPANSLAPQAMPQSELEKVPDDSGSSLEPAISSELANMNDSNVDSNAANAETQPEPEDVEIASYGQKMEVLFSKLDKLKLMRQAIRNRIQFDSPEF